MGNTSGVLNGQKVVAHIWDMAAGVPNNLIGQTDSVLIANNTDSLYTVDIDSDYLNLAPGFYTITLGEEDSTLAIGLTNSIFTLGTTWVNWPTSPFNGWANNEDFGLSFNKPYVIRANFGDVCFPTTNSFSASTCSAYTSPSGAIYNATGIYNDTILNVNGCDSILTINLTILNPTTNTFSVTSCGAYTAPSGMVYTVTGIYNDTILNANGCDSIITINLTVPAPTASSINVTSCGAYTSPNGVIYTVSGIYNDTIPNAFGCDSVITTNLTIPILNTTVTETGNGQLISNQIGGTYQWIDCDNGNSAIVGETSNIFDYSSLLSGNFAVVISEGGCVDTSACLTVAMGAITETNSLNEFSIYPNPTNDNFIVELNKVDPTTTIELVDAQGRVVMKKMATLSKMEFTTDLLLSGLYIVRVSTETTSTMKLLVVEKH
jgi:hypothetical protein